MKTDYKTVFQLAQDKGMKKPLVYIDNELYCMSYVQKWLRDSCKIIVTISVINRNEFNYFVLFGDSENDFLQDAENIYQSYEDAILNGIHEALKLIQ